MKALYRRAQGHLALADYVETEVDLKRALQEEPGNKDVRALFKRYKQQVRASRLQCLQRPALAAASSNLGACTV